MYDYTQPTCNNFSKSLLGHKKGQNCSFMLISSFAKFLPRLLGNWAGSGRSESFLILDNCVIMKVKVISIHPSSFFRIPLSNDPSHQSTFMCCGMGGGAESL